MRVIIHAGHHKTGTSTFQRICYKNNAHLAKKGIICPVINNNSCNLYLACYRAQQGDWSLFEKIFESATKKLSKDGVLLLSAEDFENGLLDKSFANSTEEKLKKFGFDRIEWVFVYRDQFDYFESLYSQLSKNGQLIDYSSMANEIIQLGYFTCRIPRFRWYFIFDYQRFYEGFRNSTDGKMTTLSYDKFCENFPGAEILRIAGLRKQEIEMLEKADSPKVNRRLREVDIERNYTRRFLGIERAKISEKMEKEVAAIAQFRNERKRQVATELKERFGQRFGTGNGK